MRCLLGFSVLCFLSDELQSGRFPLLYHLAKTNVAAEVAPTVLLCVYGWIICSTGPSLSSSSDVKHTEGEFPELKSRSDPSIRYHYIYCIGGLAAV